MWKYSRLSIWCFKTLDISQTKKCIYKSFHPFLLGILVIVIIAGYISYVGIKQIIPSDQKEKTSQECYVIYCFIQKFCLSDLHICTVVDQNKIGQSKFRLCNSIFLRNPSLKKQKCQK
jgi:hypothetical protein